MRSTTSWARLLGVLKAVVEDVVFDEDDECIVVSVRPRKATKRRCGRCGKRCPGYDRGEGRRRGRALDLGTIPAFLEADSPRVRCVEHGVVTAQLPWARHGAGHTYAFDDTAAWLLTYCSKSAVRDLLRWRGARWDRSSPAWSPTPKPPPTASPTCAGSGSTRSPVRHEALDVQAG